MDQAAPTTVALGRALRAARRDIVAAILARRGEVPAFADGSDDEVEDLRRDIETLILTLCDALEHQRPLNRGDVVYLREPFDRRARRGDRLIDIGQGLRIVQRVVYESAASLAAEADSPTEALIVGSRLLELIDVASLVASEAWSGGAGTYAGTADHRALLEILLAGREPSRPPLPDLARRLGYRPGSGVAVIAATWAVGARGERESETATLGALARAGDPRELPLATVRDGELVVLRKAPDDGAVAQLVAAQERAWRMLTDRGVRLSIGISARQTLPGGARDAFVQARLARDAVLAGGGIVALPRLEPLDWMALRADGATWELVPAAVRRFVEEDAATGGSLLRTFRGYVACDLNVKEAAKHLHANTARYRLDRIGDRTGLDLRRFEDVVTLHIAARLFETRRRG
ncbi:MAG TPA: helix-turn-helix domain-containing protein [Candidatus Acidoferrum sp.]|nr:helix-turn-helix domain-containing protein [Candidatus Acidoferrum sp.]